MNKFFCYLIAIAVSVSGTIWWVSASSERVEDAGLGINTKNYRNDDAAERIFLQNPDELKRALAESTERNTVVWLGASQLYGINDPKPGDLPAPRIAADLLSGANIRVISLAYPNASPAEHYVALTGTLTLGTPSAVVIGAVYDDMRERGIRAQITEFTESAQAQTLLKGTPIGIQLLELSAQSLSPTTDDGDNATSGPSLMDRSEAAITNFLEDQFRAETIRGEARGKIVIAVRKTRQFLEGLRARYTRDISNYRYPILPEDYVRNWQAWEAMLRLLAQRGIPTVVYIAPRPTDFFPYDPAKYEAYKAEVAQLAASTGATFVNLEDIAASETFGYVDTNFGFPVRDPFHFQGTAHKKLGNAIAATVLPLLPGPESK